MKYCGHLQKRPPWEEVKVEIVCHVSKAAITVFRVMSALMEMPALRDFFQASENPMCLMDRKKNSTVEKLQGFL